MAARAYYIYFPIHFACGAQDLRFATLPPQAGLIHPPFRMTVPVQQKQTVPERVYWRMNYIVADPVLLPAFQISMENGVLAFAPLSRFACLQPATEQHRMSIAILIRDQFAILWRGVMCCLSILSRSLYLSLV